MRAKSSNFAADLYTRVRKYVYTCAEYRVIKSQQQKNIKTQKYNETH